LEEIDGKPVLIVERFDRSDGRRIGYVSAMTMLEEKNGAQRSYLEIGANSSKSSPTGLPRTSTSSGGGSRSRP
jgi:serine/threonine-protein kinase HipA